MKPFFSFIDHVNIMIRNLFTVTTKRDPRFVVTAHILWGFVALLLPRLADATSIVLVIDHRHERIVVAGDSSVASNNPHGTDIAVTKQCKIVVMPSCVFAMAGAFTQPDTHFNLHDLATTACMNPGDLRHKADSFLGIAREPVRKLAEYLRIANPQYYAQCIINGEFLVARGLFAGVQDKKLSVFGREVLTDNMGRVQVEPQDVQYDSSAGPQLMFGGFNEGIVAYLKAHRHWDRTMDAVTASKKFVRIEIDAHPDKVGLPVSILAIDRRGSARWLERGACN
jgi:hypothetical protein